MQKQGPEQIDGDPLLENFSATRPLIKSMQILLHPAGRLAPLLYWDQINFYNVNNCRQSLHVVGVGI